MFIQCQNCQATYKIDEQKIPNKEAFVRCSRCSEPIPLNKETQSELSKQAPKKIVECENCKIRYSIPLDTIKGESTKVRCGKCGHHFTVTKKDSLSDNSLMLAERDITAPSDDIDLDNISIPQESEIEVDDLFENMDELEDEREDIPDIEENEQMQKSATDEYLESVDLSKNEIDEETDEIDEDSDDDLGIGTISEEQKYKIFLKPKGKKGSDTTEDNDWPEIQDETNSLDLNKDLDDDESDFIGLDDLEAMPDFEELPKARPKGKSTPKSKETTTKKSTFLWLLWGLIIIALLATGWFLTKERFFGDETSTPIESTDKTVSLKMLEPLNGRYVINRLNQEKIFILEGSIRSLNSNTEQINKIEVEGTLYHRADKNSQHKEKISSSVSYAGAVLKTSELEQWSREKIESFHTGDSGQHKFHLSPDGTLTIQFQIIFFIGQESFNNMEARIKRVIKKQ